MSYHPTKAGGAPPPPETFKLVLDTNRLRELGLKEVKQVGPDQIELTMTNLPLPILSDEACRAMDKLGPEQADAMYDIMAHTFRRLLFTGLLKVLK